MDRCFVIQPFDRGAFDKRYEDIVEPAIKAAGLEPYRVDRDPDVTIPIEHIEENIRNSRACVAEISTDHARGRGLAPFEPGQAGTSDPAPAKGR